MYFQISQITTDGWIALDTSIEGSEAIFYLAQAYAQKNGGELIKPYEDDAQYLIKGDPFKLLFQYDDMFGAVVVLNELEEKDKVVEVLQSIFVELKNCK